MRVLASALATEIERRGHSMRAAAREVGAPTSTFESWVKDFRLPERDSKYLPGLARYLRVHRAVILGWLGVLADQEVTTLSTGEAIPGWPIASNAPPLALAGAA